MTITYTIHESLSRGPNYMAQVILGTRHVILGHFLLDNFDNNERILKAYVQKNAVKLLKSFCYTDEEIADAR